MIINYRKNYCCPWVFTSQW